MLESTPFSQMQGTRRFFFRNTSHRNVLLSQCSPISELCSYLLHFLIDICVRCMYACAIMEKKTVLENSVFMKKKITYGACTKLYKNIQFAQ